MIRLMLNMVPVREPIQMKKCGTPGNVGHKEERRKY